MDNRILSALNQGRLLVSQMSSRYAVGVGKPRMENTLMNSAADTVRFGHYGIAEDRSGLKDPALSFPQFKTLLDQKVAGVTAQNKTDVIAELSEVMDQFLQGERDKVQQSAEFNLTLDSLQKLLGPRGQGNLIMAQINLAPGDLEGNAKKVMAYLRAGEKIGADAVVFPELTLMGYPIHDVIKRHPFIVEENLKWLQGIAAQTGKTRAIVGFVEPRKVPPGQELVGKPFFNSAAILGEGKIEGIVRKSLLPTYGEFNDDRYFERSPASGVQDPATLGDGTWGIKNKPPTGKPIEIHGKKYGLSICEDTWNIPGFDSNPLHHRDPISELAANKPDVMINISASPSRSRKEQYKHNMLTYAVDKFQIPYVYVNQVGAIDEISYDGSSRVYTPRSNPSESRLSARSKSFREQFQVVNPLQPQNKIYPLSPGLEATLTRPSSRAFDVTDTSDLGRMYETLVQGVRDYYKKIGMQRAVLGLSGGLDSTISAVILADALGPENVLGVSMPAKITSKESRDDAEILAKNLGIHYIEVPVTGVVAAIIKAMDLGLNMIKKFWPVPDMETTTAPDNFQARARAIILWGISNVVPKTLAIATSDKSEFYMGYATVNGDMSGGFAPISDVMKTQLFSLGRWMNANRDVKDAIPDVVLNKRPGAELAVDKDTKESLKAEDALMPYPFMDEVITRIERSGESYEQMLNSEFQFERIMKGTEVAQSPEAQAEIDRIQEKGLVQRDIRKAGGQITQQTKKEWLDRFYKQMSFSLFKWWIAPPTVIVNGGGSIVKSDYRQSMTSNRIKYQGTSQTDITKALAG